MGGGGKRHVIPPMPKHGGGYIPHPPGIYALGSYTCTLLLEVCTPSIGHVHYGITERQFILQQSFLLVSLQLRFYRTFLSHTHIIHNLVVDISSSLRCERHQAADAQLFCHTQTLAVPLK